MKKPLNLKCSKESMKAVWGLSTSSLVGRTCGKGRFEPGVEREGCGW